MAITQVMWIQSETYQAVDARLADSAFLGAPSTSMARPGGVVPGYGSGLALSSTGLTLTVGSGAALVPSNSGSGAYRVVNDANTTVALTVGSATPRVDTVICKVYDTGTAGTSFGAFEVVTGSGGTAPAVPAGINAVKIGEVTVTNSASSGATVVPRAYTAALGGVIPARSTARPSNPFDGCTIWETDTFNLATFSTASGTWRTVPTGNTGSWTAYTPAWTASVTNPSLLTSTINGRYIRNGNTVTFSVFLKIATLGVGNGIYAISLPVTAVTATNARWLVTAHLFDTSSAGDASSKQWVGNGLITSGGTKVDEIRLSSCHNASGVPGGIWAHDRPVTLATGDDMTITGTYECAP